MPRRLALAAVLVFAACATAPPPAPPPPMVSVAPAGPAAGLRPGVTYIGTVAGETELDLAFKIPGRILRIGPSPGRDWRDGDAVERGQVLAALDTAQLTETVRAAEARATNDAALYERGAALVAGQQIAPQEFDRLTAARDASAAELRQARAALADAELIAPFAGTILRRSARAGETVGAGTPVLRLADLARLSVDLGVPEQVVTRLQPGQRLAITAAAHPGAAFAGAVSEVAAAATAATRLFRVRVAVDNADGRLRPGMSASVAIPTQPPPDGAAAVPIQSVLADAGGRSFHVFVAVGDRVRRQPVEVVDVIGNAAVVGGLPADAQVVVAGAGLCADGMAVRTRPHVSDPLAADR